MDEWIKHTAKIHSIKDDYYLIYGICWWIIFSIFLYTLVWMKNYQNIYTWLILKLTLNCLYIDDSCGLKNMDAKFIKKLPLHLLIYIYQNYNLFFFFFFYMFNINGFFYFFVLNESINRLRNKHIYVYNDKRLIKKLNEPGKKEQRFNRLRDLVFIFILI
jgi:hypothetical protein